MSSINRLEVVWKQTDRLTEASLFERCYDLLLTNLKAIRISPLPFLVGIIVSAAVIAAVGLVLSIILNLSSALGSSQKKLPASIYLNSDLTVEEREPLEKQIAAFPAVQSVRYVSKTEALSFFQETVSNDPALLEGLKDNNPLPASFEVYFKDQEGVKSFLENLGPALKQNTLVASIEIDESLSRSLQRGLSSLSLLFWGGGIVLILIAACVIASAIALILHAHKREIEVLSLVGAKQSFIQVPYVIEGSLQGIIGGIFGVLATSMLLNAVSKVFAGSGALQILQVGGLSRALALFLILLGGFIGALASWLCVKRTVKV